MDYYLQDLVDASDLLDDLDAPGASCPADATDRLPSCRGDLCGVPFDVVLRTLTIFVNIDDSILCRICACVHPMTCQVPHRPVCMPLLVIPRVAMML